MISHRNSSMTDSYSDSAILHNYRKEVTLVTVELVKVVTTCTAFLFGTSMKSRATLSGV